MNQQILKQNYVEPIVCLLELFYLFLSLFEREIQKGHEIVY